jgi:hypothetical protein
MHLEARIAIACGVGAPEGTYMREMGERPGVPLAEGSAAPPMVVKACTSLAMPYGELARVFDIADSDVCVICLEPVGESAHSGDKILRLPQCTHLFHMGCIADWFTANNNCPTCRQVLPDKVPRQASFQELALANRLREYKKRQSSNNTAPVTAAAFTGKYYQDVVPFSSIPVSDIFEFSGGSTHALWLDVVQLLVFVIDSAFKSIGFFNSSGQLVTNPQPIEYTKDVRIQNVVKDSPSSFLILSDFWIERYAFYNTADNGTGGIKWVPMEARDRCCAHCGKRGDYSKLLHCSRCKSAAYCSKECQSPHWKSIHKACCAFNALQTSAGSKVRLMCRISRESLVEGYEVNETTRLTDRTRIQKHSTDATKVIMTSENDTGFGTSTSSRVIDLRTGIAAPPTAGLRHDDDAHTDKVGLTLEASGDDDDDFGGGDTSISVCYRGGKGETSQLVYEMEDAAFAQTVKSEVSGYIFW